MPAIDAGDREPDIAGKLPVPVLVMDQLVAIGVEDELPVHAEVRSDVVEVDVTRVVVLVTVHDPRRGLAAVACDVDPAPVVLWNGAWSGIAVELVFEPLLGLTAALVVLQSAGDPVEEQVGELLLAGGGAG